MSQPAYPTPRPAAQVAQRLEQACSAPEHVFWAADVSVLDTSVIDWRRLLGHRQITDAYLLALAGRNRGRLVTVDARIAIDVVMGATAQHLERIA